MNDIAHEIASFVRIRFRIPETDPRFDYSAHLWEEGFVDSMGLVELLAFLEERYAVQIPPDALFDEECTNINGLSLLVSRLVTGATTGEAARAA